MLNASSHLLSSLYDGKPKILVVKSRHTPVRTAMPSIRSMTLLIAETEGGESFALLDNQSRGTEIEQFGIELPPTNVWVVWSPEDGVPLNDLAAWWTRTGGNDTVPVFVRGDIAALNEALIECSLTETDRLTRANQLLVEDLAALREQWVHHVRLPPELEELLANLRLAPPRLVFETPAATGEIVVPETGNTLCQRLPMGARGLLGVDVHIAAPGNGNGDLQAVLASAESGVELAQWKVPYRDTRKGWLPLRLPVASALMERALELCVKSTGGTSALKLSTTPTGLLDEYALTGTADDHPTDAMLVFKLWGGVPGHKHASELERASLPLKPVVRIPDYLVASARSMREFTPIHPYFGYTKQGWVLLRPLRVRPSSAACISLPAMPGLATIACKAKIDNELCKTQMLVRIAIGPRGGNVDDVEQGTSALTSSEWVELAEPLKSFELTVKLSRPRSDPVDVYLFSRLPQGGTPDHGRVVFGRFEAALDERATWQQGPFMPEA